jgi:DNA adenine methylase
MSVVQDLGIGVKSIARSVPTADPLSPFIKWAGGKSQLVQELVRLVPREFNRYLEPFVGGGALFFYLRPKVSLLNDLNEELMITYGIVKSRVEELIGLLDSYPYSKKFFYDLRSQNPGELDPLSRAARMIYLNRTCFNGLYRVNKQNQFNVPFGYYRNPNICDELKLRSASRALRGVRLFNEDYKGLLEKEARKGDFIYLDPPYQPVSRYSDFKRYTSSFFYEQDQRELAQLAFGLARRGCYVLASNSDTPFIRRLYRGAQITTVHARRNINKNGDGRGQVNELLIVCRPKLFNN